VSGAKRRVQGVGRDVWSSHTFLRLILLLAVDATLII
jgi:hypothetical protein